MKPGFHDMAVYLWCCVGSACNRHGIEFGMSFLDFADRVDIADMERWK